MSDNKVIEKKKRSFISLLFSNLFGGKNKLSIKEEEQIQSPFRTVVKTFRSNKISMVALSVFILIFVIVLVGPIVKPIDLSFSETSQQNVAPGFDLMEVPPSLKGRVQDMAVGPIFTVAATTDGQLYIWGKTRISSTLDVKSVPSNMGKIVQVAAGYDHILFLNDEGEIFASGNNRQQQGTPTYAVQNLKNIKDIEAGYQASIVLTEDGWSYYFGNSMNNDYNEFHPYQG